MGQGERPTVVFVESFTWETYSALASALHLRGIRTVRLTKQPNGVGARLAGNVDRLLYDESQYCVHQSSEGHFWIDTDGGDFDGDAIDVQAQDDLIDCAAETLGAVANPARRVRAGIDPRVMSDKWAMHRFASEIGIPTPNTSEDFGDVVFPALVKARVGSGGSAVRMVHNAAQLDREWAALTTSAGVTPIVQAAMIDSGLRTGGVARDGEALVLCAYQGLPDPGDPSGPPLLIRPVADEQCEELTRQFISALGFTGFFNMDWVVDEEGKRYLIDFNARAFGSWPALQAHGWDFLGAYLDVLGVGPRPPLSSSPSRPDLDHVESVLVFPCPTPGSPADVRTWAARSMQVVTTRKAILGPRWARVSRIKIAVWSAKALPTALKNRKHSSNSI